MRVAPHKARGPVATPRASGEDAVTSDWGPLRLLEGQWEGDGGIDVAYSHHQGRIICTPYRERVTFSPFGPVVNGKQGLFGLDYRTTMWRLEDGVPFHAEVGYWLWDPKSAEILRAFVVPRGIAVLAGGTAAAGDTAFSLSAERDDSGYSISENRYLASHASSVSYHAHIVMHSESLWSYRESTTLRMAAAPEPFPHTDRNTLRRVG